jgi:hypothetical protein
MMDSSADQEEVTLNFREIVCNARKTGQTTLSDEIKQRLVTGFNNWLKGDFQIAFSCEKSNQTYTKNSSFNPINYFSWVFGNFVKDQGLDREWIPVVQYVWGSNPQDNADKEKEGDDLLSSLVSVLTDYFRERVIPSFQSHLQRKLEVEKAEANLKIDQAYDELNLSTISSLSKNYRIPLDTDKQKKLKEQVIESIHTSYKAAVEEQYKNMAGRSAETLAKLCLQNVLNYPTSNGSYKTALEKLTMIFTPQDKSIEVKTYQINRFVKWSFSELFNSSFQADETKISNACKKGNITKLVAITNLSPNSVLNQDQLQDLQKTLTSKIESISSDRKALTSNKVKKYLNDIHYPQTISVNGQKSLQAIFELKSNLSNKNLISRAKEFILEIISIIFNVDKSDKALLRKNQREVLNEITQNLPLNKQPSFSRNK